jgi:colanic acid biosynthesis glycosyl transferase WcaI
VTRMTFVCQWYPPEPMAVPESIAHSLRDQGLQVDVLTGVPNYPSGVVADGYSASRASTEIRDGIVVRRCPLYASHDTSAVNRLVNYASWALSSSLFGQRTLRGAEVALVYSSPATAALPAMVANVLWRTPYVLLVQDVWPDSIFASGFLGGRLSRIVHAAVSVFVRRSYAMADHVAVISPGMLDLLAERGVPREKLSVVYNWLPEGDLSADAGKSADVRQNLQIPADSKLFLYAGNHGRAQALDALIDAFIDHATAPAHLVLVGDGVMKTDLKRRADGHPRIHFVDPVLRAEAVRMSSAADVHVLSLADQPLFAVTMPSKLQSGLAAGLPILAVAPGDAASMVSSHRAGIAARPGDARSIATAVNQFNGMTCESLTDMGSRGRVAYERLMSRDIGAARLADLLRRAACRARPAATTDGISASNEKAKL